MSYIGKSPSFGSYSMLDNLTASATASYSLTLDSVAFVPESANHLIVSLNGVIQKAGSSFTVSSSTLTFSSALTSSDSIDFILALGNVLDIGTPSDATVTNAKTNFVSTSSAAGLQIKGDGTTDGTLQLNCSQNSHGIKLKSPAHSASQSYTLTFPTTSPSADKFLKTDGSGNLSFADAGGGKINQLVTGTLTSSVTSTSTTMADTGLSVSITPSATSSKVFLLINLGGIRMSASTYISLSIYKQVGGGGYSELRKIENGLGYINGSSFQTISKSQFYLDTTNTTSQVDYKIYFAYNGSGTNVKINVDSQEYSTITAMEVLA